MIGYHLSNEKSAGILSYRGLYATQLQYVYIKPL